MPPLFYALCVLAALLALEGLFLVLRSRRSVTHERARARLRELAREGASRSQRRSLVRRRSGLGLPTGQSLARSLQRAGLRLGPVRFLVISAALAAAGWIAVGFLLDPVRAPIGLVAGAIPLWVVRRMARKRMRQFAEQLPEGLELLTRALRAGHGIGTGFQLVGEELEDPIGPEFALVAEELRFGMELRDALDHLIERVGDEDLPYFATGVLIQRQTGGNLAELLDKLSGLLRERSQFNGKVRALTAQGRGAATFLALWVPFIAGAVYLTTPDYLRPLFENRWGHMVIATVIALDVAGYLVARRIADVQA